MTQKVPLQWKDHRPIPLMDTQLADFPGEEWKQMPVDGYEDAYHVSNYGRVKSLARNIELNNGRIVRKDERIIKLDIRQHKIAIIVKMVLSHPELKKRQSFSVSRMVYHLFVAPFDWKSKSIVVKRKDGDTLNCYYKNLIIEETGKFFRHAVNQYGKDGSFIQRFASAKEAAAATKATVSQIKEAILKKGLQNKMFYWRRDPQVPSIDLSEQKIIEEKAISSKFRAVQQLTLDGQPLEIFNSLLAAAKAMNKNNSNSIIKSCSNKKYTAYGFRWQYIDKDEADSGTKLNTRQNGVRAYNDPVHRYNINGVYKDTYSSASNAAETLGINSGAITNAIRKRYKLVDNCYWRQGAPETFIDISGFDLQRERYFNAAKKQVQQLTPDGELIKTYDSLTIAANDHGIGSSLITKACNFPTTLCLGFRWQYVK